MKASGSFAAAILCTVQIASRPLTTTGLSGPISITSGLSVVIPSSSHHTSMVTGISTKALNAAKSSAPMAPSSTRWSQDSLTARGADREDRGVRRIDDGGELAHAVHAEIGDRRRAALVIRRLKLLVARARGEVLHFRRNGADRFGLGATDDWCDQA